MAILLFGKKKRFYSFMLRMILLLFSIIAGVYLISLFLGPPPLTNDQNTVYYSDNGEEIGEETGMESRYYVTLDQISADLIKATIAIEDKNFYKHKGFDIKRIIGAMTTNLRNRSLKEGASTLTQQYARNLYLTHEKTWTRKMKEAFYTIRLEMHYSKDRILEGYVNTIYYGHGAYGIEAASNYFFDKGSKDLSLAEAAMLAGVPKGPTYYSPLNDERKAKSRQESILSLLLEQGKISKSAYTEAIEETLVFAEPESLLKQDIGAHFQDIALMEATQILELDSEFIKSSGYDIYTTLDKDMQIGLESQVTSYMDPNSDIEIGAMAMNPKTGAIQALVGGRSYKDSPYNRAVSSKRMAGSTFKPFLYYAALENNFTSTTKLMSKPTTFTLENNEVYQPSNFNGYYANDRITLAQALALSDNIYAVKTNLFLGTDKLIHAARKFGITSDLPNVPSLALGTASVSVNEMVTAYARLANGEKEINSYTVERIVDRHGKQVYERKTEIPDLNVDSANIAILTHLMTGMFDTSLNGYMSVTGSSVKNRLTRTYAGKSGTTKSDSWMIGYSPTLVTGIWTGYDDNRAIENVAETTYAKNIWASFMETAHDKKDVATFNLPEDIVEIPIDPTTGQISTPYCPTSTHMYFKRGTEPQQYCLTHFSNKEKVKEKPKDEKEKGILRRIFDIFITN